MATQLTSQKNVCSVTISSFPSSEPWDHRCKMETDSAGRGHAKEMGDETRSSSAQSHPPPPLLFLNTTPHIHIHTLYHNKVSMQERGTVRNSRVLHFFRNDCITRETAFKKITKSFQCSVVLKHSFVILTTFVSPICHSALVFGVKAWMVYITINSGKLLWFCFFVLF